TLNQNLRYMVITCHFIDTNWKLQKLVLAFKMVPTPHTGIIISDILFKCFNDWNITSKTLAITADNATNNDAAINHLKHKLDDQNMLIADGCFLRQRCCTHILNLIVSDGIKTVKSITSKIRECVKWIYSSQSRQQNFEDAIVGCCNDLILSQRPTLDVSTRWNSLYLMLVSTILYKRVFERLGLRDIGFEEIIPSDEDWNKAK
ncbi:12591_t:CDS:1, partial [Ambispora leptoticha]